LAINDSFVRRFLTIFALNTTGRVYGYHGPCVPLSKNLIVKTGPFAHLTEAATLRFVASKTSIPVPRVHCAFVRKNRAIIVMDRIEGVSFPEAWNTLSIADRDSIFKQLRAMFGIIDWEFAGWYPCYWEYTSAWQAHYTRQGREESILKFLDPHPEALNMEITRQI
jgi:hypothetical protein